MRTKVLCNADCGYNRNGVCQRNEIAITVLMQGGCIMYSKHQGYKHSNNKPVSVIPPGEEPSSLR